MDLPPTLLTLPRELRDIISTYTLLPFPSTTSTCPCTNGCHHDCFFGSSECVLDYATTPAALLPLPDAIISGKNFDEVAQCLAPISVTCWQLYWETVPLYLKDATVVFEDALSTLFLSHWLDSFGEASWKAIRILQANNFTTASSTVHHSIISRCTRLRSLTVSLRTSALYSTSTKQRTLESLLANFALHRLFEVPELENLELHLPDVVDQREKKRLEYSLKGWFVNEWIVRRPGTLLNVKAGHAEQDIYEYSDEDFCCSLFD